jgi:hypothetical protein
MKAENMKLETGFVHIAILDIDALIRNWWVVLLRGVAAIIFWPDHFLCAWYFPRRPRSPIWRVLLRRRASRYRNRDPAAERNRPLVGASP